MPISTTCPTCKAIFRLGEELAGKKVKCQKCQALFIVPAADDGMTIVAGVSAEERKRTTGLGKNTPSPAGAVAAPLPLLPEDKQETIEVVVDDSGNGRVKAGTPASATDERRPPARARRREDTPKSGSSMTPVVLAALGLALFSCVACAGVGAFWLAVTPQQAKHDFGFQDGPRNDFKRKDRGKGFPKDFPADGFKNVERKEPQFVGFKDGKLPEPPSPGPPGSIPVIFGADGNFRSDNALNLADPVNNVGKRHKLYIVRMEAGRTYQIDMLSNPNQLDAYLYLKDQANNPLTEDDDSGGFPNARIIFTPERSGIFHVEASFFPNPGMNNPVGDFTLLIRHLK